MSHCWDELRAMPEATAEEREAVDRALGVVYDWNENGDILALGVLRALREEKGSASERQAWARLVKAARAAAVANVSPTTSEVVVQHREEELDAAKTVLRNHDVDVDGLLKEQR